MTADGADDADKTIREICAIRGQWIEKDRRSLRAFSGIVNKGVAGPRVSLWSTREPPLARIRDRPRFNSESFRGILPFITFKVGERTRQIAGQFPENKAPIPSNNPIPMNTHPFLSAVPVALALVLALAPAPAAAAQLPGDISPPRQRKSAVATAQWLVRPATSAAVNSDVINPFAPPGFEISETILPTPALTDRQVLELIAARIAPAGIITLGGKRLLVVGSHRIVPGQTFALSCDNKDYALSLVALGTDTFTLRYRRDEITRSVGRGR